MLTGLKVSSLACKYVLYRPEHNVKVFEIWNWNERTDRTQGVDEKNVILLSYSFVKQKITLKGNKI